MSDRFETLLEIARSGKDPGRVLEEVKAKLEEIVTGRSADLDVKLAKLDETFAAQALALRQQSEEQRRRDYLRLEDGTAEKIRRRAEKLTQDQAQLAAEARMDTAKLSEAAAAERVAIFQRSEKLLASNLAELEERRMLAHNSLQAEEAEAAAERAAEEAEAAIERARRLSE